MNDIRPVLRYDAPGIPTRPQVDDFPELLQAVPERWRVNPVVMTALAGTMFLVTTLKTEALEKEPPHRVAPIFEHGDGRGAYGCVVVSPPAFLSEDEARQVIIEEAKKAGLKFTAPGAELSNVNLPITSTHPGSARADDKKKPTTRKASLTFDGTDTKNMISFEFVSSKDFEQWETGGVNGSTVSSYDMLGTARLLKQGLVYRSVPGTYAVFYDPGCNASDLQKLPGYKAPKAGEEVDWNARYEQEQFQARELAHNELRKQVQDFIKWLKGEGII
jgi:hypothetical protein